MADDALQKWIDDGLPKLHLEERTPSGIAAATWHEADKQAVKRTLERVASQLHIRANLESHPITKPCKDTAALLYELADDIRQMKP